MQTQRGPSTHGDSQKTLHAAATRRKPYAIWGASGALAVVVVALITLLVWRGALVGARAGAGPSSPTATAGPIFTPTGAPVTLGAGIAGVRQDSDHAFVGNAAGTSLQSVTLPPLSGNTSMSATYFLSSTVGWAGTSVSSDGSVCALSVYRTTAGGNAWQAPATIPLHTCVSAGVESFSFHDEQHGWMSVATIRGMSANAGEVYSTSDGGATWTPLASEPAGTLWFTSPTTGWMISGHTPTSRDLFLTTSDGGKVWTNVALPIPSSLGNAFAPSLSAPLWFTTNDGAIAAAFIQNSAQQNQTLVVFRTSDGGKSWTVAKQFTIPANQSIGIPASAIAGNRGFIAGPGTTLFTSADAGHTWTATKAPSATLTAINSGAHFSDALHGWAFNRQQTCAGPKGSMTCVTADTILRTTDGGQTWTPTSTSF